MKKLLDFPKTARKRHNPFSWLVAAHGQAQATRKNPLQRKTIKFRMVRGVKNCGASTMPSDCPSYFNGR